MNIISEQQTDEACVIKPVNGLSETFIGEPVAKEVYA